MGKEINMNLQKNKSTVVIIEDELIYPFKIYIEKDQNVLVENIVSGDGTREVDIGYYRHIESAINEIVKRSIAKKYNQHVITLKKYIQEYKKLTEEFLVNIKS